MLTGILLAGRIILGSAHEHLAKPPSFPSSAPGTASRQASWPERDLLHSMCSSCGGHRSCCIYARNLRVRLGFGLSLPPCPGGRLMCVSCSSGRHLAYNVPQTLSRDNVLATRQTVPITGAHRGLSLPSHRAGYHPGQTVLSHHAPRLAHNRKACRGRDTQAS